jgi:ubiquinone/menaquinone biosynthesis C-methylase UbiE
MFYPQRTLVSEYRKKSIEAWLSPRLPDYTNSYTLFMMNIAINCCEQWGIFMDVGAGSGHFSIPLLGKFSKGYLVEIDPQASLALSAIKKKYKNAVLFKKDILTTKIPEKNIDYILLADVFEHITLSKIKKFIKILSEVQQNSGVVHVLTPNPLYCGPAQESGLYYKKFPFGHHKHYTQQEVVKLFAQAGYEPLYLGYQEAPLRRWLKVPLIIISHLDAQFLSFLPYRFITAPVFLLLRIVFYSLSRIAILGEHLLNQNPFFCMTSEYIFKKSNV